MARDRECAVVRDRVGHRPTRSARGAELFAGGDIEDDDGAFDAALIDVVRGQQASAARVERDLVHGGRALEVTQLSARARIPQRRAALVASRDANAIGMERRCWRNVAAREFAQQRAARRIEDPRGAKQRVGHDERSVGVALRERCGAAFIERRYTMAGAQRIQHGAARFRRVVQRYRLQREDDRAFALRACELAALEQLHVRFGFAPHRVGRFELAFFAQELQAIARCCVVGDRCERIGREFDGAREVAALSRFVGRSRESLCVSLGCHARSDDCAADPDDGDEGRARCDGRAAVATQPFAHPLHGRRCLCSDRFEPQEPSQVVLKLRGRRVTALRVLLQRLLADDDEVSRHARVALRDRHRIAETDLVDDLLQVLALERPAQREQLVEDHAEREDVRAVVLRDLLLERLLRAHVVDGARDVERRREPFLFESLRKAEVEQPHFLLVVDHHVARLQVAMREARCMRACERGREVGAEARAVGDVALRHSRIAADPERAIDHERVVAQILSQVVEDRAEVAAWHELHRERERVLDFQERVNRDDRRVPQARRGSGLATEALDMARAQREPGRENLERHATAQRRLLREVDDAHAAAAEFVLDPILAKAPTRGFCRRAVVLDDGAEEVVELQEVAAPRADLLAQRFGVALREGGGLEIVLLAARLDERLDGALHEVAVVDVRRKSLLPVLLLATAVGHLRSPRRPRASPTVELARGSRARARPPRTAGRARCRSPRCRAPCSGAA